MRIQAGAVLASIVCTLSGEIANAQVIRPAVPRSWAKTYGGLSPYEGLFDLRRAGDGGVIAAGTSSSFGSPSGAGWLLDLDLADGRVRSQHVVHNSFGGFTDGAGLAADGGALFCGRIVLDIYTKHDASVVRVDAQGNPLWWRGFTHNGFGRHFLNDAVELDDGSWIVAGAHSLIDQPPQNGWIVRLSAQGDLLWQYEYGGGIADHLQSVAKTADGGAVAAGWTNSTGAGSDDAWVLKIGADGTIDWQWTYGAADSDHANGITELQAGGFAVAGSTSSLTSSGHAPWLLRLDAQGQLLRHLVANDVWGDLQAVAETRAGGLVALGRVGEAGFPTNDLWAIELAPNGSVRWQRAYEGASGDWGSAVLPLPGTARVLGGTWGWGFPEEDVWIVRTASNGRLPHCGLARRTHFPLIAPPISVPPAASVRTTATAIDRPLAFSTTLSDAQGVERCH